MNEPTPPRDKREKTSSFGPVKPAQKKSANGQAFSKQAWISAGKAGTVPLLALLLLGANPQDQAAADALFKAGRAAAASGDYRTACARFRESDRLDPALGTKFNLADCEEHLGHVVAAWTLYLELVQKLPPADDRLPVAKEHSAALEKRLPKLLVRLAPNSAGASVAQDGEVLGDTMLGIAVPVEAGPHRIVVTAPEREPRNYPIVAVESITTEITVEQGPLLRGPVATSTGAPPATAVPTVPMGEGPSPWPRTLGLVAIGTGALALVTGAITGGLALDYKGQLDAAGCKGKTCTLTPGGPTLMDINGIAANGDVVEKISTAGFIAGAALASAGIVLVLTHPRSREIKVAPAAGTAGVGFRLQGSF